MKPGQPVVVSELYNTVFTGPRERAAPDRLFDTYFEMPLYMAQHRKGAGRPPTLAEISEQFRFTVPGAALPRRGPACPRMRARPRSGAAYLVRVLLTVVGTATSQRGASRHVGSWPSS